MTMAKSYKEQVAELIEQDDQFSFICEKEPSLFFEKNVHHCKTAKAPFDVEGSLHWNVDTLILKQKCPTYKWRCRGWYISINEYFTLNKWATGEIPKTNKFDANISLFLHPDSLELKVDRIEKIPKGSKQHATCSLSGLCIMEYTKEVEVKEVLYHFDQWVSKNNNSKQKIDVATFNYLPKGE